MLKIPTVLLKDGYKIDHRSQYPNNTEVVYSNVTARGSRIPGVKSIVVFGPQYFVKEYCINRFNRDFFNLPKEEAVRKYKRRVDFYVGPDKVTYDHIAALWDLQYLPIEIKAIPEGMICPIRVPMLTIKNTLPEFFWITNMLETILCNVIWQPMTSATIAREYRKILNQFAKLTSDMPDFVQWQGHDFSMRGMGSFEASLVSGAAHLLSFTGTDTVPAIDFLETYYNADCEKELIGGSVPATEHSVMCLGGYESEEETYRRLLTQVYPEGIVSIVSDTWDYWKVLTETLPKIKDLVMSRNGKLVVRPDSGDPVEIICGFDHEKKYGKNAVHGDFRARGSIEILWDIFGGTINSKGYKQLDPHIGLIYGDSITMERCRAICEGLEAKGFASTNIVFGIGSYTYQYNTRDTFGFAMKATYGIINGVPHEIYKKPKTDDGIKNSAKGLLCVNEDMTLTECCTPEQAEGGMLKTIFRDGKLLVDYSLEEIRKRVADSLLI